MSSTRTRIQPFRDEAALARAFRSAEPIHAFVLDDFLAPDLFERARRAFPSYREALALGQAFDAVNESGKVQVPDRRRFPEPLRVVDRLLASEEFVAGLARITGIAGLVADGELTGGGLHVMAPGGRLDVHVDFNRIPERRLHRRLNALLFFTDDWDDSWGGLFELWDPEVKRRQLAAAPRPNRLVCFQTSPVSFHGVTPVRSPGCERRSFATYFYTPEADAASTLDYHSTVFRARPDEWWRGRVAMPAERLARRLRASVRRLRGGGR